MTGEERNPSPHNLTYDAAKYQTSLDDQGEGQEGQKLTDYVSAGSALETDRKSEAWRGLKDAFPVMLGFVRFALVLGAQASAKGFTVAEVPLMTGLNFGGGSEFAAVELWSSPPHVLLIAAITFLVNSRQLLMGAAFAPLMRH